MSQTSPEHFPQPPGSDRSLEERLAEAECQLANARHELNSVYASTSWKLTTGLRFIGRAKLRVKRKIKRELLSVAKRVQPLLIRHPHLFGIASRAMLRWPKLRLWCRVAMGSHPPPPVVQHDMPIRYAGDMDPYTQSILIEIEDAVNLKMAEKS